MFFPLSQQALIGFITRKSHRSRKQKEIVNFRSGWLLHLQILFFKTLKSIISNRLCKTNRLYCPLRLLRNTTRSELFYILHLLLTQKLQQHY